MMGWLRSMTETIRDRDSAGRRQSPTIESAGGEQQVIIKAVAPVAGRNVGSITSKRVVLVGGGLPHLLCLRALGRAPLSGARLIVVSPAKAIVYSGMLPGLIAGHYALERCCVPIEALARAAGVEFIEGAVASVDPARRHVRLSSGEALDYDLLSIDVGSSIDTNALPGADAHAILVRPLEAFVTRWLALKRQLDVRDSAHLVVVGAGSGGVELALAARHALAAFRNVHVCIVSATATLPGRSGPRLQRRLRAAGIVVHNGVAIRVDEREVHLAEGASLRADAVIVATGSAAPRWLAASGLPVDGTGYARVGPTLGVIGQPEIFASGDCASIEGRPQSRSGVHALRMGPTLLENLRRSVDGAALVTYTPRQRALHLMSAGDRYAVGAWGGIAFEGRWVWRWKDRIDRAFIARHTPGGPARG